MIQNIKIKLTKGEIITVPASVQRGLAINRFLNSEQESLGFYVVTHVASGMSLQPDSKTPCNSLLEANDFRKRLSEMADWTKERFSLDEKESLFYQIFGDKLRK